MWWAPDVVGLYADLVVAVTPCTRGCTPCRCASGSTFMPPHRAFTSFAGAEPGRGRAAGADEGRAGLFFRTGDEGRWLVGLLLLGF